jgi:hypothetical protein
MNKPTYPLFIGENGQYIDYEISYELPSDLDNEHSVVVRLSYDTSEKTAYGSVVYEQNGDHEELGHLQITNEQFYRITNHPIRPEDKLQKLLPLLHEALDALVERGDETTEPWIRKQLSDLGVS